MELKKRIECYDIYYAEITARLKRYLIIDNISKEYHMLNEANEPKYNKLGTVMANDIFDALKLGLDKKGFKYNE